MMTSPALPPFPTLMQPSPRRERPRVLTRPTVPTRTMMRLRPARANHAADAGVAAGAGATGRPIRTMPRRAPARRLVGPTMPAAPRTMAPIGAQRAPLKMAARPPMVTVTATRVVRAGKRAAREAAAGGAGAARAAGPTALRAMGSRRARGAPAAASRSRAARRTTMRSPRSRGRPGWRPRNSAAARADPTAGPVPHPDRGGVPCPAGVGGAADGRAPARRADPDRGARGRRPGGALRVVGVELVDDRQRLPWSRPERAAQHGGSLRRHRPRPERRALRR